MSVIINVKDSCMICLDEEGEMITGICDCVTTKVHKKCLNKWIYTKQDYVCEICNKMYSRSVRNQYIMWRLLRFKIKFKIKFINMLILFSIIVVIVILSIFVYNKISEN